MPSLNTVVLVSTDAKRTKGVLVDSINNFKSAVSSGVLFSSTDISGPWVDLVLENQPKAVELYKAYASRHPHLNDYYVVSEDQQSLKVTERGNSALSFNCHLNYLRSIGIIDFQTLFTAKPDRKPLDYKIDTGWLITSNI